MPTIQSGKFISAGLDVSVYVRSDLDWMYVYNYTTSSAISGVGCQFYWQRGMDAGTGLVYSKTGGTDALELQDLASDGFTLFDTSIPLVSNAVATTASSNVVRPIISTGSTANLVDGNVVVLASIGAAPTICGIPFEVDTIIANTSFRIKWPLANAPGAVGGAGTYRILKSGTHLYDPYRKYVVDIASVGVTTVVTTSVTHNVTVGEKVRMYVPDAANGMVEINNLSGSVTAIDLVNNTFTLDIDSSSFSAFVWPAAADSPYTPAQCFAFGSEASGNQTLLDDATRNDSGIGIKLGGGVGFPAGDTNDVIYWVAGKSDATFFEDFTI
jgi:hypothetical protein